MPVTGVKSLLDWASTTVAPPISDIANRTVPKIFLIVEFLRLLFPRQRVNLLDPRLRQRNARAAVPSIAINFTVGTEKCSARHPALSR